MSSKNSRKKKESEFNKVLKKNQEDSAKNNDILKESNIVVNNDIENSLNIMRKLGYSTDIEVVPDEYSSIEKSNAPIIKSWESILDEANQLYVGEITFDDIFTQQEVHENSQYIRSLRTQFREINKLDKWDFAVAGITGTIAALIDYFLVTEVKLDSKAVRPGSLKSGVEDLWDKLLTPEKIKELEEKYKVPYDISTNTGKIAQEVLGLNPKTHRFQSLGHDPILGFIFGVRDLMKGELTAIDGYGRVIIQNVSGAKQTDFITAIITAFGHMLSDVNTVSATGMRLSIPAPLTPLLQMAQFGSVSYSGKTYTIADLSKRMYRDGYNFNHFIGMSVPVAIIHIIIHIYVILRNLISDKYIANSHKNDIMIFIANSILCAENIGKLVVTNNPFAINYVSWVDTAKYSIKAMKYVMIDYKVEQLDYVQQVIDQEYYDVYELINRNWRNILENKPFLEIS